MVKKKQSRVTPTPMGVRLSTPWSGDEGGSSGPPQPEQHRQKRHRDRDILGHGIHSGVQDAKAMDWIDNQHELVPYYPTRLYCTSSRSDTVGPCGMAIWQCMHSIVVGPCAGVNRK